jgi:hypothetical protein
MTPAEEIRAAAEKLRGLIAFLGDNRGPWYVSAPESGYPQTVSNMGVPYLVATTYTGPEIPIFATAEYIAATHPGVGKAVAAWLESWDGIELSEGGPLPDDFAHALAVARAVNNGGPRD